jgi:hypothetical protein
MSRARVVEAGELGALRIRLGDCVNGLGDASVVESVQGVPCSQPHELEVYHAFNLTAASWPGEATVEHLAAEGCYRAFEGFVGHPYETSVLDFATLYPSEASWNEFHDREVLCLVGNYDGTDKTGTARGAGV